MPRRGLPETVRMRHDEHYVEALAASAGTPIGRLITIDRIDPNPNQPRQVMGDLSELMASVAEKGVIEPLIVRSRGDRFQIIAGERRYQAAVQVGLRELPVVIRDVDDTEVIELALDGTDRAVPSAASVCATAVTGIRLSRRRTSSAPTCRPPSCWSPPSAARRCATKRRS